MSFLHLDAQLRRKSVCQIGGLMASLPSRIRDCWDFINRDSVSGLFLLQGVLCGGAVRYVTSLFERGRSEIETQAFFQATASRVAESSMTASRLVR